MFSASHQRERRRIDHKIMYVASCKLKSEAGHYVERYLRFKPQTHTERLVD